MAFGLLKIIGGGAAAASVPQAADQRVQTATVEADAGTAIPSYDELLARWLGFSDMQRQCLDALANEVRRTSELVETSTLEISSRFRDLAASAKEQTQRVEDIISVANSVTIDGESIALDHVVATMQEILVEMVNNIVNLSKRMLS
jgi:methyl-accepting chemotaxis protein